MRYEWDFLTCPRSSDVRPDFSNVPEADQPDVLTECWVEGCCFEQRLLDPSEHIAFRPLSISLPLPGTSKIQVHLSGFTVENATYYKRLVKALGMNFSEKLGKQTTHLVCLQTKGQKYEKALEWGVHVVRPEWLVDMAKTGRMGREAAFKHGTEVKVDLEQGESG